MKSAWRNKSCIFILFCLTLALACIPYTSWSALLPEEIAVVINGTSAESVTIAKSYMKLRNIPDRNLVTLTITEKESIARIDYDNLIASPLRKAINSINSNGGNIRCLTIIYGMPLRISAYKPPSFSKDEINKSRLLKKEKEKELALYRERNADKSNPDSTLKQLEKDIKVIKQKLRLLYKPNTVAALDSELALLLVPDYNLENWRANPEYLYNRASNINYFGRVLMVSRLDAPTPELVNRMIRDALDVEKTGLTGTIYLDARGKTGNDPYSQYDEDVRRTASLLQKSRLSVVLENTPKLLKSGDAPDAALYCGWYSHKKYVDAFEWSRGAVGYHVASSEAVSLHDPKKKYWVKSMIEDGVIASVGPVGEPYLGAFPLPSLFFPLLMSGRYTLVEVFAMTNPFLSWRMILVGDPLYNPFKNMPAYPMTNAPAPPA